MKTNEFKAWYRRNDPQNARKGMGAYNRPYKERYERPPEFPAASEAYNHYSAMQDLSAEQEAYQNGEENKENRASSDSAEKSKQERAKRTRASNATRGAVQAVAGPVVGVVAGATILVAGCYQAIESEASFEFLPIVTTVECDWSGDFSTATITLLDEEGNVIVASLPARVNATETVAPTCTTEGTKTYTAVAKYEEEEYSKSYEEAIAPLKHSFGEGVLSTNEDGDPVVVYECDHCHEKIERSPFDIEETEE